MDDAGEAVPLPPEGFSPSARGPYTSHNGPMFHRNGPDGGYEHAFFALPRHCNSMGIIHGGMIATFMDGVLARAAHGATGGHAAVTIHLSLDFLSAGRAGEWIFGDGRVTRQTRDLIFVEGRIRLEDRDLARASAIFKPMRRKID
jgi:uncharacterized protein (TIGR00369 family)